MKTQFIKWPTLAVFFVFFANFAFAQTLSVPGAVYQNQSGSELKYTHTSLGGISIIRSNPSYHRSQLGFYQSSNLRWAIGVDYFSNNTNDFFINGGTSNDNRFYINSSGLIGINTTSPQQLLTIQGGDLKVKEIAGSPLDLGGPGADLILEDAQGGILNIFSKDKVGMINLGGGATELRILKWSGQVVMGDVTPKPGYKLVVSQGILTEKLKIAVSSDAVNWSDFVFEPSYKLRPLSEVEAFVKENKHLPEIPSADEVYESGLDVVQMDAKLLQKIEELTLYMIELEKRNNALEERLKSLEQKQQ